MSFGHGSFSTKSDTTKSVTWISLLSLLGSQVFSLQNVANESRHLAGGKV